MNPEYWVTLQAAANLIKARIRRQAAISEKIGPPPEIHTFNTGRKHQYLVVWQPLVRQPWRISYN